MDNRIMTCEFEYKVHRQFSYGCLFNLNVHHRILLFLSQKLCPFSRPTGSNGVNAIYYPTRVKVQLSKKKGY